MESEKLTEAVTETIFGMYTPTANLQPTPIPEPQLEEELEDDVADNLPKGKATSDYGKQGPRKESLDAFDTEIASIYEQHGDLLREMPEEMDMDYEDSEEHEGMSDRELLEHIASKINDHLGADDMEEYDDEDMMEAVRLQESLKQRLMEACKYSGYRGDACPTELKADGDKLMDLKYAETGYAPYHKGTGKKMYYKGGKCYINMNGCPREVNAKDCIYCDLGDAKTSYGPSGSLFS